MSIPTGSGLTHLILTNIRTDINDDDATQTYSDDQLKIFVGKAASLLNTRLYNVPVGSGSVPLIYNWSSGTAIFSDTFNDTTLTLLEMQVECLIAKRNYAKAISKGIQVRDGDTEINLTGGLSAYKDFIGNVKFGICAQLDKLIDDLNRSVGGVENYGSLIWHGNSRIYEQHSHSDSYGIDERFEVLPDIDDILNY